MHAAIFWEPGGCSKNSWDDFVQFVPILLLVLSHLKVWLSERCLMQDLRLASSLMSIGKKPLQKQKIIFLFLNFVSLLRVFILCTFCLAGVPKGRAPGVFWHHKRRWLQLDDDGAPSHRVWASKLNCLPAWQWHLLHHLPGHPPRNWAASVVCSFLRQKNGKASAEAGH